MFKAINQKAIFMKAKIFFPLFVFFAQILLAQHPVAPGYYVVYFKDKKGTPYSIDKPEEFLSPKAIERYKKNNVQITEQDLPVNPQYVKALKDLGVEVTEVSKWLNCAIIYTEDTSMFPQIRSLEFVTQRRYVQGPKNYEYKKVEPIKPKKYPEVKSPYKDIADLVQMRMLNTDKLHALGYKGQGITLAVLDNGFRNLDKIEAFSHLFENKRFLGGYDFVDRDSNVFDGGTHGLEVFSTIAAVIPGKFMGMAPEANFYLFKTENANSEYQKEEYNFVCGLELADSLGVDVVTASLGYSDFDDDTNDYNPQRDINGNYAVSTIGADIAASKGIVVVISAGNSGDEDWHYITPAADGDSVIAVGAVTWTGKITSFSSRGPTSDGRIKPDVCAVGMATICIDTEGKLTAASGTSLASPLISGSILCLYSAFPDLPAREIYNAVLGSGNYAKKPNNDYGYGIPDFLKAYYYLKQKEETLKSNGNEEN